MILEFIYNGTVRIVLVEKNTDTYIQGQNLHADAAIPAATYSKAKMSGIKILKNQPAMAALA